MSRLSPHLLRLNWFHRLIAVTQILKVERDKRFKELELEAVLEVSKAQSMAKNTQKLAEQRKQFAEEATEEMKLAHAYLNEGKALCLDDLDVTAKLKIQRIKDQGNLGICSSCRFQYGCLRCDVAKAERYYLRKEAERRGYPVEALKLRFLAALDV
jgi:hypothetical protein